MKRLLAAALAVSMLAVIGCSKSQPQQSSPSVSGQKADAGNLTAEELLKKYTAGEKLTIVDVRTEEEYAQGHISGSHLVPLQTLEQGIAKFPKEQEIYLICRSGNRSGQAYTILQKMGYSKLHNVVGGMQDWEKAGGPIGK